MLVVAAGGLHRVPGMEEGAVAADAGQRQALYLPLTSTAADLDARKALKRALDPAGILNPGVILPAR